MSDAAPKDIEHVDLRNRKTLEKIAVHSTNAGHPTTLKEVDAQDNSVFENIKESIGEAKEDVIQSIKTSGTLLGGEELTTYDRTAPDKKVIDIATLREHKKAA